MQDMYVFVRIRRWGHTMRDEAGFVERESVMGCFSSAVP